MLDGGSESLLRLISICVPDLTESMLLMLHHRHSTLYTLNLNERCNIYSNSSLMCYKHRITKIFRVCGSMHLQSLKWNTQLDTTVSRKILLLCRADTAQHVSAIIMPETCWAVSVRQSNKIFRLIVASSWVFYLSTKICSVLSRIIYVPCLNNYASISIFSMVGIVDSSS